MSLRELSRVAERCIQLSFAANLIFAISSHAAPLPSWLEPLLPQRGPSYEDEMMCYSLPYGGIGFVNHLFTYWTIFWQHRLRKPSWPRRRLKHSNIEYIIAALTFFGTIPVAIFTMIRCHQRWPFVSIAIWKLLLSLELTLWTVRAGLAAADHKAERLPTNVTFLMMIWYIMAVAAGLPGLITLVAQNWTEESVRLATYVFVSVCAFFALLLLIMYMIKVEAESYAQFFQGVLVVILFAIPLLFAFYNDWVLAAISHNWVGIPSGNVAQVLYWVRYTCHI